MQEEEAKGLGPDEAHFNEQVPQVTYMNSHQALPRIQAYDPCSAKVSFGLNIEKIWSP